MRSCAPGILLVYIFCFVRVMALDLSKKFSVFQFDLKSVRRLTKQWSVGAPESYVHDCMDTFLVLTISVKQCWQCFAISAFFLNMLFSLYLFLSNNVYCITQHHDISFVLLSQDNHTELPLVRDLRFCFWPTTGGTSRFGCSRCTWRRDGVHTGESRAISYLFRLQVDHLINPCFISIRKSDDLRIKLRNPWNKFFKLPLFDLSIINFRDIKLKNLN
jgi:hypothetical protein